MFINQEKKTKIEKVISKFDLPDFKWIDPKDIIVAHWVRMKCNYGCDGYGRACCPPNVPPIIECQEFFREYTSAIIFHTRFDAEKNNYPKALSQKLYNSLVELERSVFLQGYHKAFVFNQSCCSLCKDCMNKKEECKHPEKQRPSPEAFGVDVYGTVRNVGFEINVVTKLHQEIDRFAILLIE